MSPGSRVQRKVPCCLPLGPPQRGTTARHAAGATPGPTLRSPACRHHPTRNATLLFRSVVNNFSLALPTSGLAYLAAPSTNPLNAPQAPPAGAPPSFEEVGVNSVGLAVSATETLFHSNASLAADPLNLESGISEDDIPSIVLPQARTAREAVQVREGRGRGGRECRP